MTMVVMNLGTPKETDLSIAMSHFLNRTASIIPSFSDISSTVKDQAKSRQELEVITSAGCALTARLGFGGPEIHSCLDMNLMYAGR